MNQPMMGTDPTSVVGRRVLAYLVDGFLMLLVAGIVFVAASDLTVIEGTTDCSLYETSGYVCFEPEEDSSGDITDDSILLVKTTGIVLASVVIGGYGVGFIWIIQGLTGWTPGKLIAGIRVVNANGTGPGIGRSFLRWIMYIVDGQCSGIIGLVLMLTTKGHRRLGDMVAKTFVVRSSARGVPVVVPGLTVQPAMAGAPYHPGQMPTAPPQPYGAPPLQQPQGFVASAAPTAPPSAAPDTQPQWDPQRNAWIQWDPVAQVWKGFDDASKEWKPLS